MEFRTLGRSGLKVPVLSFGTGTFGGGSFLRPGGERCWPKLLALVDALHEVARETEKTVPQLALNWRVQRPTVSTVIVGARNEERLRQNLPAVGWNLSREQIAKLDAASAVTPIYPLAPVAVYGKKSTTGVAPFNRKSKTTKGHEGNLTGKLREPS
jgi:aryl-alcohol dehydrogenase-like predicted oxidoreductase